MYHLSEAYLMSGLICLLAAYLGALTFGTVAVAPLAVNVLSEEGGVKLLRRFWLRLHRFAVLVGFMLTLICGIGAFYSAVPLSYSTLMIAIAGFMTICFFAGLQLIPQINRARDLGDQKTFSRLHRWDVVLVAIGLLAGALLLVGLVYVLPGQFTFWPLQSAGYAV